MQGRTEEAGTQKCCAPRLKRILRRHTSFHTIIHRAAFAVVSPSSTQNSSSINLIMVVAVSFSAVLISHCHSPSSRSSRTDLCDNVVDVTSSSALDVVEIKCQYHGGATQRRPTTTTTTTKQRRRRRRNSPSSSIVQPPMRFPGCSRTQLLNASDGHYSLERLRTKSEVLGGGDGGGDTRGEGGGDGGE
jgi:hypothetical protein